MKNGKKLFSILNFVLSFVFIFCAVFGFKYIKSIVFPNKQALFFKELYDLEIVNNNKEIKSLISEDLITEKKFQKYEMTIRKNYNLKMTFYNKYSKKLEYCFSHFNDPKEGFKIKMEKCYYLSANYLGDMKQFHTKKNKLLSDAFGKDFLKNTKEEVEMDIKGGRLTKALFYLMATSNYQINDEVGFLFSSQKDLDSFNTIRNEFEKLDKKYEQKEAERLANLKKHSQQVKMGVDDIALSSALAIIGSRRR